SHGAVAIDFGLGPLRLELTQDAGKLSDLALIKAELVRQEAQRPADTKAASAAGEPFIPFLGGTFPATTSGTAASPCATRTKLLERTLSVPPETMHNFSPSCGAIRTRLGFLVWAPCLTILFIVNYKGS